MGLGGIVGAVAGSVLSGVVGGKGAKDAANIQAQASERAFEENKPFAEAGKGALTQLQTLLGLSPTGGGTAAPGATAGKGATTTSGGVPQGVNAQRVREFLMGNVSQEDEPNEFFQLQDAVSKLQASGANLRNFRDADLEAAYGGGGSAAGEVAQRPTRAAEGARGSGPGSIAKLFESTPGYQFQIEQSEKAIKRAGAAGWSSGSGRLYNQLVENAQGLASTTFQQHLQNLFGLVQTGQAAASGQASAIQAGGEARAAGTIGQAQALRGGISDIFTAIGSQSRTPSFQSFSSAAGGRTSLPSTLIIPGE